MAHYRGIFGFEGGDASGLTLTGGTVTSLAARAGGSSYGYRCATNSASAQLPVLIPTSGLSYGDNYDVKIRVHFRVNSYPVVADFEVFRLGTGADTPALLMNSSGQIKLLTKGALTTGFSAGSLTLGEYYQADVRLYGYIGDGTEAGRRKESITVYDSSGAEVFSAANPTQDDSTHATRTPANGGYGGAAGSGSPCSVAKVTEGRITVSTGFGIDAGWVQAYLHSLNDDGDPTLVVHGVAFSGFPSASATYFNTDWTVDGVSENQTIVQDACDFPANFSGRMYETGELRPFYSALDADGDPIYEDFSEFRLQTAPQLSSGTLVLGDPRATSRSIDYDDLWFDVKIGDDVDGSPDFPTGTHIFRNDVTAQGPSDEFSPSGAFSRISEVPLGANTIAGTFEQATDYQHQQIDGSVPKIEHVRVYMNAKDSGASGNHYVLFAGVQYAVIAGATIAAGSSTIVADRIGDMARAAFNEATVGGQNNESGHTMTIGNIYMEVLQAPSVTIDPFHFVVNGDSGPNACSDWPSQEVDPGTDPLSPVDDIFGDC